MVSAFEQDFIDAARAGHFLLFGVDVDYTPPGKAARAMKAILGPVAVERIESDEGEVERKSRMITVAADVDSDAGGIDDSNLKGAFTIDGEIWAVERIAERDGIEMIVEAVRIAPARVGRKVHDNPLRK